MTSASCSWFVQLTTPQSERHDTGLLYTKLTLKQLQARVPEVACTLTRTHAHTHTHTRTCMSGARARSSVLSHAHTCMCVCARVRQRSHPNVHDRACVRARARSVIWYILYIYYSVRKISLKAFHTHRMTSNLPSHKYDSWDCPAVQSAPFLYVQSVLYNKAYKQSLPRDSSSLLPPPEPVAISSSFQSFFIRAHVFFSNHDQFSKYFKPVLPHCI